jgi:lactate racemase
MLQTYNLKYGDTYQTISINDGDYEIDVIQPHFTPAAQSPIYDLISSQINNPLGSFDWKNLTPLTHPRVAIAINDKTRPVPHEQMLPPLLDFLKKKGYSSDHIVFIIATGTHTPMPEIEFSKILPEQLYKEYRVISHNCDDLLNLQYLGETSAHTPIWINREYFNSDIKIGIGNIEPHHFMGFSGGNKSVSIGVTGRETITTNHAMITSPNAVVGYYENNPMRMDVEEIGDRIGVNCVLNVIMNTKREIVHALFGSPRAVMKKGVDLCRDVYQTSVAHPYDMVIASVGGYPKDINFYQAQKAMTHSALIVKPGGTVILCAECREGSGSAGYEAIMESSADYPQAMQRFLSQPFQIGPHKAYQVAKLLEKIDFYLVSSLSPALSKMLNLKSYSNLQGVFEQLKLQIPLQAAIAILPNAINTIPIVKE